MPAPPTFHAVAAATLDDESLALLALARTPELGPARIAVLLEAFGSARAAVTAARDVDGPALPGLSRTGRRRALRAIDLDAAVLEAARGRRLDARLVCAGTDHYPASWRPRDGWPLVLWTRGAWPPAVLATVPVALAVVGPRRASAAGCGFAAAVAERAAWAGAWVVSGLAFGIDAAAHGAAIAAARAGAPVSTIAVLASGVDRPTPVAHRGLARSILDAGGTLVAAAAIGAAPPPGAFPVRNRWIAGLAGAVAVIEAGGRSGALHTASAALDLGREVRVAPARPWDDHAAGSLALLRDGASPLIEPDDGWRALPAGTVGVEEPRRRAPAPWDRVLIATPRRAEDLAGLAGLSLGRAVAALEEGVLDGWARRAGAQGYAARHTGRAT